MKLEYVVVYERTPNNYCAYLPDLPGCVSTGKSWDDIRKNVREAVTGHIEVMLEYGEPLPEKPMSLEEATEYHNEPIDGHVRDTLAQFGDDVPSLSTTFGTVEVEVELHPAATTG
jgi:predicted RNase H-like HicB family nuclease